jgi:hypothetical protein
MQGDATYSVAWSFKELQVWYSSLLEQPPVLLRSICKPVLLLTARVWTCTRLPRTQHDEDMEPEKHYRPQKKRCRWTDSAKRIRKWRAAAPRCTKNPAERAISPTDEWKPGGARALRDTHRHQRGPGSPANRTITIFENS